MKTAPGPDLKKKHKKILKKLRILEVRSKKEKKKLNKEEKTGAIFF